MDIKGANLYREHLMGSSSGDRGHRHQHMTSVNEQNSVVESILVCTGVYNPQNDLRFHVRKLLKDDEVAFSKSAAGGRLIELPQEEAEELNENELRRAMSHNSFISYFDDKMNIPDHTFDNLRHSVDYILKSLNK